MKHPCTKDCPDRTPSCRPTCARYAEYEKWYLEEDKKRLAKRRGCGSTYAHQKQQIYNIRFRTRTGKRWS